MNLKPGSLKEIDQFSQACIEWSPFGTNEWSPFGTNVFKKKSMRIMLQYRNHALLNILFININSVVNMLYNAFLCLIGCSIMNKLKQNRIPVFACDTVNF